MMRTQESMAPKSSLTSTAYNRQRTSAPARPAARHAGQRPTANRPSAKRVVDGSTNVKSGKKRSVATMMLVVTALVAGVILAFAVLT